MDLYAYVQIEDYDALAKANGIEIPRLRGYRWMENEKCLSEEDIENCLNEARARAYEHVLTADPPFSINPEYYTLSYTTDQRKKKYLIQEEQTRVYYPPDNPEGKSYTTTVIKEFRWDLLHGKRRKAVKYYLKKELRYEKHQLAVWNKYAGQKMFCISMPVLGLQTGAVLRGKISGHFRGFWMDVMMPVIEAIVIYMQRLIRSL